MANSMLTLTSGIVTTADAWGDDAQELAVDVGGVSRRAINYLAIVGTVAVGDHVLLNTTAQTLGLGTGGYDFVVARWDSATTEGNYPLSIVNYPSPSGHIIKGRYLPCQVSVQTLEEQEEHAWIWDLDLAGMPVLVGQLHSQVIPAAAGLIHGGLAKIVYVMTDGAALPIAFSRNVRAAKSHGLIAATITCGQSFGGDYETVTVHSALLAAKHLLKADAVIVCQGPGNAGTGTRHGFSGIEQAAILDAVAALGGRPVAIARISSADTRARHQGVSHHTVTSLRLAFARCLVPLPTGTNVDASDIADRHEVREVRGAEEVLDALVESGLPLSTMGRTPATDRVFFLAAIAAGLAAAQ